MNIIKTIKKALSSVSSIDIDDEERKLIVAESCPAPSDSLLLKIKEQFTSNEQEIFTMSFYNYLKYDDEKDFIIDLDNVYKQIGYTRKSNAKRALENNFDLNIDYKSTLLPKEQGQIQLEQILLNIDTFKSLCMLAKTDQGKQIRKYYLKMEKIMHQHIQEQNLLTQEQNLLIQEQLYLKDSELQIKDQENLIIQEQLLIKDAENIIIQEQLVKFTTRKYEEIEKSGHIYILSTDKHDFHKCGKTKGTVKKRIQGLQTGCVDDIQILYDFNCSNEDVLEKVVHYILGHYRSNSNREHFTCNIQHTKKILDICGIVIDTCKSSFEAITQEELIEKIISNLNVKEIYDEFVDSEEGHEIQKPNEVTKQLDNYIQQNKSDVDEFIETYLEYSEGSKLHCKEVYEIFENWCIEENKEKIKRKDLDDLIESIFEIEIKKYTKIHGIKNYGWENIRLIQR
jgi:phage anti-repressor protein/transcription termination factor NusB